MLLHQLVSVLILPFNVLLVIPSLLFLRCREKRTSRPVPDAALPVSRGLGALLVLAGLPMLAWTIREFGRSGQGTLAPWDPTQKLVCTALTAMCAIR